MVHETTQDPLTFTFHTIIHRIKSHNDTRSMRFTKWIQQSKVDVSAGHFVYEKCSKWLLCYESLWTTEHNSPYHISLYKPETGTKDLSCGNLGTLKDSLSSQRPKWILQWKVVNRKYDYSTESHRRDLSKSHLRPMVFLVCQLISHLENRDKGGGGTFPSHRPLT